MRAELLSIALGMGLLLSTGAIAQKSVDATATCKDGSSYAGASKSGACRGHKGVATWGTPVAATSTSTAPASTTPPPASLAANTAGSAGAKSGAAGQVWVNSSTKVYHCPGTRYYGKTKQGEYMTEVAAKAAGDHPSGGKACS